MIPLGHTGQYHLRGVDGGGDSIGEGVPFARIGGEEANGGDSRAQRDSQDNTNIDNSFYRIYAVSTQHMQKSSISAHHSPLLLKLQPIYPVGPPGPGRRIEWNEPSSAPHRR
jgi:hypothetical protein